MALRQQVWVDKSVQGVLIGRVLLYWTCAMLYVGIGSACFQYNQNPEWTTARHIKVLFGQMWPWLPTAILVLPLTIYDVVRLSNLFAGPVYRLRRHFARMREDIACAPLTFREDDYWRDLAAPINDMQAEILRLRSGVIELQSAAAKSSVLLADFQARLAERASNQVPAGDRDVTATQAPDFAIQIADEKIAVESSKAPPPAMPDLTADATSTAATPPAAVG